MLGVRPGVDVVVNDADVVDLARNHNRGLSVAPRPEDLPPAHRPRGLRGGESVLPCWSLEVSTLWSEGDGLQVVQTSNKHAVVATTEDVLIDDLQARLCNTKGRWRRC